MTTLHECHVVVSLPDLCILWVGTNWDEAVEAISLTHCRYSTEIQVWIGSERTIRYRNVQNEWVII